LSEAIEPFVPHYDALLLANHGAVTCGPTFSRRSSNGDHRAQREDHPGCGDGGQPVLLSSREVAKLMALVRVTLSRLPPGGGAELPITATAEKTRAMTDADAQRTRCADRRSRAQGPLAR